ncbi:MAG: hypothetical protein IPM23_23290 [Candidatus Melainabacteria bacterium]|nr:hypothetical protein [Candidatus Melainabacteria bacterium]
MPIRSSRGAVLALVIVSALVLIVLGIGLLFLVMQLGGGQELQHATDAGNLNVAKQVLRRPGTALLSGDEINHFGDSDDPATNEVNLLTYNRLAAQAFLVSANAQALGTAPGSTHAQQMLALVKEVADRLNSQLTSPGNFDQHFHNVATNHAMRMLEASNNAVQHLGTQHETSLMARGAASNAYINANQILSGGPNLNSLTVDGPNGRKYLVGYQQLAAAGAESLWAVPVRPGQPPHLVSDRNFQQLKPRGPIPGFVPPNAFRSAGLAVDQKASGMQTRALSNSIVGSLDQIFGASIPRGVIIVDNTGSLSGTQVNGAFDIWQDKLMDPNYVEVMGNPNSGLIADQSAGNSPTLKDVKNYVQNNYSALSSGDTAAQNTLASMIQNAGVDSFGGYPSNPSQLASDQGFIDFVNGAGVTNCSNGSPDHSVQPTTMASNGGNPCDLDKFLNLYGQGQGGNNGTTPVNNLMAVERFHMDICQERSSGAECATITASATNTGLKRYSTNDCGLTSVTEGTLQQLLQQTNATSIVPQLQTYMRQMKPEASAAEMNNVLGSIVPFNQVSYIYVDPNSNNLVLSSTPPSWNLPDISNPSLNLPDGNQTNYTRAANPFRLDGITNCDGECGYPHPWDCPLDSQAVGQDTTQWTPSSGFRNILGVIKFRNEANGGGQFCCPC